MKPGDFCLIADIIRLDDIGLFPSAKSTKYAFSSDIQRNFEECRSKPNGTAVAAFLSMKSRQTKPLVGSVDVATGGPHGSLGVPARAEEAILPRADKILEKHPPIIDVDLLASPVTHTVSLEFTSRCNLRCV
jgi:hypothetical protein